MIARGLEHRGPGHPYLLAMARRIFPVSESKDRFRLTRGSKETTTDMHRWILSTVSAPVAQRLYDGPGLQEAETPAGDAWRLTPDHCRIPRQSALVGAAQRSRTSGVDQDRAPGEPGPAGCHRQCRTVSRSATSLQIRPGSLRSAITGESIRTYHNTNSDALDVWTGSDHSQPASRWIRWDRL